MEERDLRWEVGQAKIELVSLVEKICKILGLEHEGKFEEEGDGKRQYNLLEKITEIQNSV